MRYFQNAASGCAWCLALIFFPVHPHPAQIGSCFRLPDNGAWVNCSRQYLRIGLDRSFSWHGHA